MDNQAIQDHLEGDFSSRSGIAKHRPGRDWSERLVRDELVNVGVAEYYVTHNPHTLVSFGLGSCVGVALYDVKKKIGGLAHIMLPESAAVTRKGSPGKYADTAIKAMVKEMERLGSVRRDIRAKVAGGACMFSIPGAINPRNIPGPCLGIQIGERNIEAVMKTLKELKIPVMAKDIGYTTASLTASCG